MLRVRNTVSTVVWQVCRTSACSLIAVLVLTSCDRDNMRAIQGSPAVSAAVPHGERIRDLPKDTYVLTAAMEKRAGIKTSVVQMRALSKNITFSSSVEPTTNGSAIVNSLVRGTVTRIMADVGEHVKKGQVLFYINCPELSEAQSGWLSAKAKLQEAKAELTLTENRVSLAKSELERQQTLKGEGISSTKQVQMAQAALASTEAELAAAKAGLLASRSLVASAESKLNAFGLSTARINDTALTSELSVRSPIDGIVVKKTIQPGQTVNPNGGNNLVTQEALFSIVNLSKVWVMLEVPQSEVAALKVGAPVTFTSEVAPGIEFHGRVITPGEIFDAASRTVGVRVEINNQSGILKPGMLVLATAQEGIIGKPVVAVENDAIQEIDGQPCVFCLCAPHTYRKIDVAKGARNADFTQITQGLKTGDNVVTQGSFVLKSEALKASLVPDQD